MNTSSCPVCPVCDLPPTAPPPPPNLPMKEAFGARGDDAELLAAVMSNLPVAFVLVLVFALLHRVFADLFYANDSHGKTPEHPSGVFAWMPFVARMPDEQYMRHAGVDALTFVEYMRLVARVLAGFFVWNVIVSTPAYVGSAYDWIADDGGNATVPVHFLGRASLANLRSVHNGAEWDESLALAVSLIGMYLNSIHVYWQLKRSWRRMIVWCQLAMATPGEPSSHAMLVRSTNPAQKPIRAEQALALWQGIYPGEVYGVRMVRDVGKLPKLLPKLDARLKVLDGLRPKLAAATEAASGEPADSIGARAAARAKKVRAKLEAQVEKVEEQLAVLRAAVADERVRHCQPQHDEGLSYFVLFHTTRAATIVKQVVSIPNAHFAIEAAPVPSAVRWASLRPLAQRTRIPASLGATALYISALFFFAIPIGFVSLLMNLDNLTSLPLVGPVFKEVLAALGPTAESFVAALLPTLALIVFTALLPSFCVLVASLQGHASLGHVQARAFSLFYRFQYCWSFVLLSLGSSLLSEMQDILDRPTSLFGKLAEGLAGTSTYYICLLVVFTFVGLPTAELARPVPVLVAALKRKLGLLQPAECPVWPIKYHVVWTKLSFVATIGIVYATIAPLTTVFALAYVLAALGLFKRNLLFTYGHAAESRGAFFPTGSATLLQILGTAQLLLAAVHLSKGSLATFFLTLPLLPLTYLANCHARKEFAPQLETLPLMDKVKTKEGGILAKPNRAAVMDLEVRFVAKLQRKRTESALEGLFGDAYVQPELLHEEITHPSEPVARKRGVRVVSILQRKLFSSKGSGSKGSGGVENGSNGATQLEGDDQPLADAVGTRSSNRASISTRLAYSLHSMMSIEATDEEFYDAAEGSAPAAAPPDEATTDPSAVPSIAVERV